MQATMAHFELAIIGGGITGTAIARDAAGRGISVLLVEQNDLASGATATAIGLVHPDLHAPAHGRRLLRNEVAEREILLRTASHLVQPIRLVLPSMENARAALRRRARLFAYDYLSGRGSLRGTRTLDLTHHLRGVPLRRRYTYGFEYSDCLVDASRLAVLNARDAADRGALIRTHTRCTRADRGERWTLILNARGRRDVATARVLVNAAGAWAPQVGETVLRVPDPARMRLVKSSHIVVPRLYEHDAAYALPASDGQVVFALPFAGDFTLLGPVEQTFIGDLASPTPSADEIAFLCATANAYFRRPIGGEDVLSAVAGVTASVERDRDGTTPGGAALWFDRPPPLAPLLTVQSGTAATARRLAEAAVARLAHFFAGQAPWTGRAAVPGGDFRRGRFDALVDDLRGRWPFLDAAEARRLAAAYGTRAQRFLNHATRPEDLGERFGASLTAAELRYLMREEWAETAEDVLWRRSKLGLVLSPAEKEALAHFMIASLGT